MSVGPIWETPSKPGRDGIGFDYLTVVKQELGIPFVAIGGINDDNIDEVMDFEPHMAGYFRVTDIWHAQSQMRVNSK